MKTKALLLTLALVGSCFAEDPKGQPNPEVAKIDARLAELKTIWTQETSEINRLTNFKRTPVQEGSQAYYACLKASQRIQQAEAEAKTLKEKRARLENGNEVATSPQGNSGGKNDNQPQGLENKLMAIATKDVTYDRKVHGPKVKGLFIGMTAAQFKNAGNELVKVYTEEKILSKVEKVENSFAVEYYYKHNNNLQRTSSILTGTIDQNGLLTKVDIRSDLTEKAFKTEDLEENEFVARFEKAYNVDFTPIFQEIADRMTARYKAITPEGVLIEIFLSCITIQKTVSEKEADDAFN